MRERESGRLVAAEGHCCQPGCRREGHEVQGGATVIPLPFGTTAHLVEHTIHACCFACVPRERLIEQSRFFEHLPYVRDLACAPRADHLIESVRFVKHRPHAHNSAHSPRPERLVEFACLREHVVHACGLAHVPSVNRLIEIARHVEHVMQRCDFGNVPRVERLIEDGRLLEHSLRRATARARRVINSRALV